jgi:hypothetical protein
MPTPQLKYVPHAGQALMHQARADGARRIVAKIGRRWGKTRFAIGDMMAAYQTVLAQHRPESMVPPFHAWLVVPDYPQARQSWNEMAELIPREWRIKEQPSEWTFWLRGNANWQNRNGFVEVKSAFNSDTLQTTGIDYLWVCEAQDVTNEAFEKVLPVSRSPGVLGWQYFEGIPSTYPEHWFERAYMEASRNPAHFAKTAPTFENPLLTPTDLEEIESDKEILSVAAWERLYLARVSDNANFFQGIDQCISGDLLEMPVPGREYVAGLDIGWTNDPSVMVMFDLHERKIVAHWEWDTAYSWVRTRETILQIHEEWGFKRLVFDASSGGGKGVEEDLATTHLPVEPFAIVGERRMDMLNRLAGALARNTISFPPIRPLMRQLRAMQMRRMPGGTFRLQVPRGEHDDYIFAVALGLSACADPRRVEPNRLGGRSNRYVQTQAEVDGTSPRRSNGAKMMAKRKSDRIALRADMAGVDR